MFSSKKIEKKYYYFSPFLAAGWCPKILAFAQKYCFAQLQRLQTPEPLCSYDYAASQDKAKIHYTSLSVTSP